MANRRLISRTVVDTDKFAMMSLNARYLYFELLVRADDDGFIGAPMRVVRMVGCTESELEELECNGYIIKFKNGIVVIRDWKIHNTIRKDMYKCTIYQEEFSMLCEINGRYYLKTECTDNVTDGVTCDVTDNVTDSVTCGVTQSVTSNVTLSKDKISKDKVSKKDICTEPEESVSMPPVISLILNDKSLHDIFQSDIDGWKELYPAVDILQELRKMKGWLDSNPAKRKTQRGIKRFINGWLAREQDRSGTTADRDGTDGAGIKRFISGKSNEELEKGIHDIVTSRISQEALDRYHDKIHELIRLCCPFEIFTQEQIDYMRREWKMEPLHKDSAFVVPREDIYDFYDRKLGVSKGIETN